MLPAIVFIFSRAACDDAVRQVVRDGVRLTDSAERAAIRAGGRAPGGAAGRRGPARPRLRRVARGPRARRGRAPRRPGAGLPRDGGGVLRRRAAQGGLRHRDPVARDQHAGPLGRDRALHQVRRRRAGHPHLGRVPAAHGPSRAAGASTRRVTPSSPGPARSPSPRRPGWPRPRRRTCARPSAPPTTWPSTWCRASTGRPPSEVLQRSFAQWQARTPDLLLQQLGHRLAVLERAGLRGGLERDPGGPPAVPHLPRGRPPGRRGARRRRPGRRRARRPGRRPLGGRLRAPPGPAASRAQPGPPAGEAAPARCRTGWATSARSELAWRSDALAVLAERIRAIEELHLVPRTRQPAPGPGHGRGLLGPGRVVLDRPRRWPPGTSASWPRATSSAR